MSEPTKEQIKDGIADLTERVQAGIERLKADLLGWKAAESEMRAACREQRERAEEAEARLAEEKLNHKNAAAKIAFLRARIVNVEEALREMLGAFETVSSVGWQRWSRHFPGPARKAYAVLVAQPKEPHEE